MIDLKAISDCEDWAYDKFGASSRTIEFFQRVYKIYWRWLFFKGDLRRIYMTCAPWTWAREYDKDYSALNRIRAIRTIRWFSGLSAARIKASISRTS
jgi:hypothetical protein